MRRYFNTEALCVLDEHYMVRLDDRVAEIKERYVDRGKYFVINRDRQYGKTTALYALAEYLKEEYEVFFLDFQEMTEAEYRNAEAFSVAFAKLLIKASGVSDAENGSAWMEPVFQFAHSDGGHMMSELFARISRMCADSPKPVVLLIDEVDIERIPFSLMEQSVNLGMMFGFLKEQDGQVAVANRIFEMALLNMFMAEEASGSEAFRYGQRDMIGRKDRPLSIM